jgi:hypothetical protein
MQHNLKLFSVLFVSGCWAGLLWPVITHASINQIDDNNNKKHKNLAPKRKRPKPSEKMICIIFIICQIIHNLHKRIRIIYCIEKYHECECRVINKLSYCTVPATKTENVKLFFEQVVINLVFLGLKGEKMEWWVRKRNDNMQSERKLFDTYRANPVSYCWTFGSRERSSSGWCWCSGWAFGCVEFWIQMLCTSAVGRECLRNIGSEENIRIDGYNLRWTNLHHAPNSRCLMVTGRCPRRWEISQNLAPNWTLDGPWPKWKTSKIIIVRNWLKFELLYWRIWVFFISIMDAIVTHAWLGFVVGNTENDDMYFGGKVNRKNKNNKEENKMENNENRKRKLFWLVEKTS